MKNIKDQEGKRISQGWEVRQWEERHFAEKKKGKTARRLAREASESARTRLETAKLVEVHSEDEQRRNRRAVGTVGRVGGSKIHKSPNKPEQ